MAVAPQDAPGLDGALLMHRRDHAIDGTMELPDQAP